MEYKIRELKRPDKSIIPLSYLDKREPEILTEGYVAELNREIAYRIRDLDARNMVAVDEETICKLGNSRKLTR